MKIPLELTYNCGLDCLHCFRDKRDEEMSLGTISRIFRQAACIGVDNFVFTGGEPLLHSRFDEIAALAIERGISFSVVTSGFGLDRGRRGLRRARRHKLLKSISLSVDGPDRESHCTLRSSKGFDYVTSMVKFCRDEDIPLVIGSLLHNAWISRIPEMIDTAYDFGAVRLVLITPVPTTALLESGLMPTVSELKPLRETVSVLSKSSPVQLAVDANSFFRSAALECETVTRGAFSVTPSGAVSFCCGLQPSSDRPNAVVADITDTHIVDVAMTHRRASDIVLENRYEKARSGKLDDGDFFRCFACWYRFTGSTESGLRWRKLAKRWIEF